MAEKKDDTTSGVDDAYNDLQRQRAEAAKNGPKGPADDIFDINEGQAAAASYDDDDGYDPFSGLDSDGGATEEEQEEAEAENERRDQEEDTNDSEDGDDDYRPDRSEETRAREDEREKLRNDDVDETTPQEAGAETAGAAEANKPPGATVEEQEEAEAENIRRDAMGKGAKGAKGAETAAEGAAEDTAETAAEDALEGVADEALVDTGVGAVVVGVNEVSKRLFHIDLFKVDLFLVGGIILGVLGLIIALALGMTGFFSASGGGEGGGGGGAAGLCQPLPQADSSSSAGFLQLPESENYVIRGGGSPSSQQWALPETIALLEGVGSVYTQKYPGQKIVIGDLSLKNGGVYGGHVSHGNGDDIDVTSDGPKSFLMSSSNYDKNMSIELGKIFFDSKAIEYIFYNDSDVWTPVNKYATDNSLPGLMEYWDGHADHYHVRIEASKYKEACNL